jgi:hypothetical protein
MRRSLSFPLAVSTVFGFIKAAGFLDFLLHYPYAAYSKSVSKVELSFNTIQNCLILWLVGRRSSLDLNVAQVRLGTKNRREPSSYS